MNLLNVSTRLLTRLLDTVRDYLLRLISLLRLSDYPLVLIIAMFIGIAGGYGGISIQFGIHKFQELFWHGSPTLEYLRELPWWWKIAAPVSGGVLVGLIIQFFSREAKGHGVPEVMEALLLRDGIIRPRVVIAKLFGSALYIASGGSVGREGPVIQIGSAIGSAVGQFLKVNSTRMRTFVACGAAAGIASAFNAPVAGALFSLEILLGDFTAMQFSPIVVASVAATVVSRHYLGDFPAFEVSPFEMVSPLELPLYVILGFLCAGTAMLFVKTLYTAEEFSDKYQIPDSVKGALGGLLIGCIGIFMPEIFGVGYDSIVSALNSSMVWHMALLLVFMKVVATSISLGSGGSGGIFAPSLFLGAVTGAFFGGVIHMIFPETTAHAGAYALVGMGGVVAATTHGPLTAILIIFEMTNDYKIILPLMLTCILAAIIAIRMNRHSIYTLKLFRRGINLDRGHEVNLLKRVSVEEVYNRQSYTVPQDAPFPEVLGQLMKSDRSCLLVTDPDGNLLGVITLNEIRQTLLNYDELKNLLIAADILDTEFHSIRITDGLDFAMKAFERYQLEEMPVMDKDGSIAGVLLKGDVIRTYNRLVALKDVSSEISTGIKHAPQRDSVHVIDDYYVREVEVPLSFLDRNIMELNIRNRYHLDILLIGIEEENELKYHLPKAIFRFRPGQKLVVFGRQEHIARLG